MGGGTECEGICPRCRKARYSPQQKPFNQYFPTAWLDTCTCSARLPAQVLADQVRELLVDETTKPPFDGPVK
jgi:hypothetical protein